jgi:hypothetical protein
MLASRGGAQIIYSAAVDCQWAPHAGVISPHFLLPLGGLCCLRPARLVIPQSCGFGEYCEYRH